MFVLGLLIVMAATAPPAAAPANMTKLVVRLIGPGVKPGSIAAMPKTIYVAPPHYARIEDAPDAKQGVQKLTIIAEPDAYGANLISHQGTHAADQGGANDLHVPIVLSLDPKHSCGSLDRIEFGDELAFFEDAGAKKQAGPIINAKPTDEYVLPHAKLVVNSESGKPIRLTWGCGDGAYTYEYTSVDELPFDPKLFSRPDGITWREIPPDDGTEHGG